MNAKNVWRNLKNSFLVIILFLSIVLLVTPLAFAIGNPVKISNSSTNDVVFPQIAADSSGYLHVAWQEVTPEQSWGGNVVNPGIFYSRWNGDTWSSPMKISENTLFSENPALTSDSSNTVYVVWDEKLPSDGSWRIHYKTRSSAGTWSSIETLPLATGTTIDWAPKIALDNSNTPHVVLTANTGNIRDSIYWTRKQADIWTTPELISLNSSSETITDSQWVDMRSDSSGNLYLIYQSWSQGVFYRKYNGTSWGTPFQLTASGVEYPRIAVSPAGEVFVTWLAGSEVKVRWTQTSIWQPEYTLTTVGTNSFWGYPIIGVTTDSKERAHVGWGEKDGGNLIDLRFRTFQSGTWGPTRDVDLDNNDADSPFVFRDKWDNQHFVWTEYNPANTRWELYYRVAEGTIQSVGSNGGTITANPSNTTYATLSIPANALASDTEIGIQIGPVPDNVDPTQVTIPRAFTFRPHGLLFINSQVATANIFYTDPEVVSIDERQLKSWLWNSQTNAWEAKSTKNTPAQNKISIDLTGFSLYGISGPIVNTDWLSPAQNETVDSSSYLIQFQMGYKDAASFLLPQTPEELELVLKNSRGDIVKTLRYTNDNAGIRYDRDNNVFKALFQFKKDNIADGNYTLEVYLAGNLVGSQEFTLER